MEIKNILVVGGAGYVGSHVCKLLHRRGFEITVVDNLETGHAAAVKWGRLIQASILDVPTLLSVFAREPFDAVFHFAASSIVPESVADPYKYYSNNLGGTLNLLQAMRQFEVRRLVFSSTAAIFGEPLSAVIDETHPVRPINAYGRSKAAVEDMLEDAARAYGLSAATFRYFNAAGADPDGEIGESHEPETHLIPRLCQLAAGAAVEVTINGDDYATKDGTCVRDYVHVADIGDAHVLGLDYLIANPGFHAFNLGAGHGHSVREVVEKVRAVSGVGFKVPLAGRRAGDPAMLVASNERARRCLDWRPKYDLDSIVRHALAWQRNRTF